MTDVTANRSVVEAMWTQFEKSKDWSLLESIYAQDFIRVGDKTIDRAEWFGQLRALYEAFPDHRITIHITVAEDDLVAYRWTAQATHKGAYFGAPPTGRIASATGITISKFRGGKIVEEHASWNKLAFLQDLGILALTR
ncbi:ester cyclase [Methylopila sp. M107]|uniref:ester cyclase n=1 Tax=Methylopila sp. M107 TaxID=1101190 RepID=UPI000368EC2A|nr:ester cyclase [Methylopila sp. M107]